MRSLGCTHHIYTLSHWMCVYLATKYVSSLPLEFICPQHVHIGIHSKTENKYLSSNCTSQQRCAIRIQVHPIGVYMSKCWAVLGSNSLGYTHPHLKRAHCLLVTYRNSGFFFWFFILLTKVNQNGKTHILIDTHIPEW